MLVRSRALAECAAGFRQWFWGAEPSAQAAAEGGAQRGRAQYRSGVGLTPGPDAANRSALFVPFAAGCFPHGKKREAGPALRCRSRRGPRHCDWGRRCENHWETGKAQLTVDPAARRPAEQYSRQRSSGLKNGSGPRGPPVPRRSPP